MVAPMVNVAIERGAHKLLKKAVGKDGKMRAAVTNAVRTYAEKMLRQQAEAQSNQNQSIPDSSAA